MVESSEKVLKSDMKCDMKVTYEEEAWEGF